MHQYILQKTGWTLNKTIISIQVHEHFWKVSANNWTLVKGAINIKSPCQTTYGKRAFVSYIFVFYFEAGFYLDVWLQRQRFKTEIPKQNSKITPPPLNADVLSTADCFFEGDLTPTICTIPISDPLVYKLIICFPSGLTLSQRQTGSAIFTGLCEPSDKYSHTCGLFLLLNADKKHVRICITYYRRLEQVLFP